MHRCAFALLLLFSVQVFAQHGTAPTGRYPNGYGGSTFTGKVTQASSEGLTLTYEKGSHSETFIGRLQDSCNVPRSDGSNKRMESSELPVGAVIMAYYMGVTKKTDAGKQKVNEVFAISFVEYNGVKVAQKGLFWCTPPGSVRVLKVFNGEPPVDPEKTITTPSF